MESAFLISILLLVAYAALALYDGVFLHLYKYKLFAHNQSKFEHLTHTIRAVLFVGILATVYLNIENNTLFYVGITLIALDIATLLIDAYVEKDSRAFMGGLPRWEYIIHLLVNGFHFAGIALLLAIKIQITSSGAQLVTNFDGVTNLQYLKTLSVNLLPGSVLIAVLHILVLVPRFSVRFSKLKFSCC